MKQLFVISALVLLAACQAQSSSPPEQVVSGTPEAVEKDIAENQEDAKTASGEIVNATALQAAFDADCPETTVQNAICRATDDPSQFGCDYALKGENVFSMKHVSIAEDGDTWKLIDIPSHCAKQ